MLHNKQTFQESPAAPLYHCASLFQK